MKAFQRVEHTNRRGFRKVGLRFDLRNLVEFTDSVSKSDIFFRQATLKLIQAMVFELLDLTDADDVSLFHTADDGWSVTLYDMNVTPNLHHLEEVFATAVSAAFIQLGLALPLARPGADELAFDEGDGEVSSGVTGVI